MSRWRAVGWAYAACAWALVFGAVSFYWAAGGRLGTETIGPGLTALADDPRFVAFGLWGAGALKVMAGLLALALVRRWGSRTPRRLLRAALGGGGLLLIVYGGASWIQHALMLAGAIRVPEALGLTAARWHFVLWDPWWVLGGLLLVLTSWSDIHIRTESGKGLQVRSSSPAAGQSPD